MQTSRISAALVAIASTIGCAEDDPSTGRERSPATTDPPPAPLATEGDPPLPPDPCVEISGRAAIALSGAASEADVACGRDDDCTMIVPTTSCAALCGLAVSRLGAAQIAEAVAAATGSDCIDFEARGCSRDAPSCSPALSVACVLGECQLVYLD